MKRSTVFKSRRAAGLVIAVAAAIGFLISNPASWSYDISPAVAVNEQAEDTATQGGDGTSGQEGESRLAAVVLEKLEVKGRAPKTNYKRTEFYDNWPNVDGCSLRQRIIKRDFGETAVVSKNCDVTAGKFYEPYTGQIVEFSNKSEISKGVQIDHVVALSDAWQKGAQYMSKETRYAMATDPLNLLAVDASANQQKSDGDAATWLPSNKSFRCQYVARQISVKYKYTLWVTESEKEAMERVLTSCPAQTVYGV